MTTIHEGYPHLANAPIVEAVIDWRAKLPATFEIAQLKRVEDLISRGYSDVEEQQQFEHLLRVAESEPQQSFRQLGVQAYRYRSPDGTRIAVLKRDGFSFSRLKPYTSWEEVFAEALTLWGIYSSLVKPEEISRIAVRYINRLLLPLPIPNFAEYLTAPPTLPGKIPQLLSAFMTQTVVHEPGSDIAARITQAIESGPVEEELPILLDIDVFINKSFSPENDDWWDLFAGLRAMKNRIFFASLTTKTVELFQ